MDELKLRNKAQAKKDEGFHLVHNIPCDDILLLLDECETLRKEAKRYRWLRDKSESLHSFYLSIPLWMTGVRFRQEDVDRSIDDAIAIGEKANA